MYKHDYYRENEGTFIKIKKIKIYSGMICWLHGNNVEPHNTQTTFLNPVFVPIVLSIIFSSNIPVWNVLKIGTKLEKKIVLIILSISMM